MISPIKPRTKAFNLLKCQAIAGDLVVHDRLDDPDQGIYERDNRSTTNWLDRSIDPDLHDQELMITPRASDLL